MTKEELDEFIRSCSMLMGLMLSEIETQVAKARGAAERLNVALQNVGQAQNFDTVWHDLQVMAEAAASDRVMDFCVRGKMPPPAEIFDLS